MFQTKKKLSCRSFWYQSIPCLLVHIVAHCFDWFLWMSCREIAKHLSLPPVKLHCSMLAEDAIKAAVKDYQAKKTKPSDGSSEAPPVEKAANAWLLRWNDDEKYLRSGFLPVGSLVATIMVVLDQTSIKVHVFNYQKKKFLFLFSFCVVSTLSWTNNFFVIM